MTTNNSLNYSPAQYNVLIGTADNNITSVAPTASSSLRTVLTSAGSSANPSFSYAPSVSYTINRQVFTSSGTYTPTTNMKYCIIECIGGGAGAGSIGATIGFISCTGGGGAGAYSKGLYSAATIGASQILTIGAGGGAASSGGTTSVGTIITSGGGSNSSSTNSSINGFTLAGGAGSVVSSGSDFAWQGGPGAPSLGMRNSATLVITAQGGKGGSCFYGGGGLGTVSNASTPTTVSINGNAATSYGGGGSGCISAIGGAASTGGSGYSGLVIITEFVQ